jgi:tripartite-type tricarboxylate transporter receptor subunit TctC
MRTLSFLFALLACANAYSQSFPSKPMRIVVSFAPGGSVDALARLVSPKMADALGQPVLVENRGGANGMLGLEAVAKANPDGYTMLHSTNNIAISAALYRKLNFDAARDFSGISQLVATELVLIVSPKLQAASVKELMALSGSKPDGLNFGSTGVAGSLHLAMEMLRNATGIQFVTIPYKGDAPVNAAVVSGEVDLAMSTIAASQPHLKSGRVRAIGVTMQKRSSLFPDIPTISEGGVAGYDFSGWQGLLAPSRTPREITQRLSSEAVKALNHSEVLPRVRGLGQEPVGSTPDEFDAKLKGDIAKFVKLVKEARIPMQD